MNYFNEKLSAECDVDNGLRNLSEVPKNGDHYLNYFANPDRKQMDTHYLAVNFLKNQNYTEEWSSPAARQPITPADIFFSVENKNNTLKLIIQTGHHVRHADNAAKKDATTEDISYSRNTAETIIKKNNTPEKLKSDYIDNSNDTADAIDPESTDNHSDKYNWLKVLGIFCHLCNGIFQSKVDFDEHFRVTHPGTKVSYACSKCKKDFEIYHRFRNHCYRHLIGGRYKCTDCSRSFSQRNQLLEHTKAFHSENSRPDGKPFICEPCGKAFITKAGLSGHTRFHHNDTQVQYTCQECGKVLHTGSGLATHVAAHKVGRQFMCHVCGMSFVQKVNMLLHVKRHKGQQPFLCTFCPLSFPSRSALASHVAFHANGRQFKCPTCQKLYKTERDLKVHSLTHADRRPFVCDTCGKGFLTSTKLKQHSNIHTGERPYGCQHCQMTFTNVPNLIKHTKKKHKVHHKTGMPLDYTDVPGKDGVAESVISTSDDSTMSVINNFAVIASYEGTPSVASSSQESGISSISDSDGVMHFIPAPAEDSGYFVKEPAAHKSDRVESDIYRDDSELSNIDAESVVSMDLSDNSVLLYNERMENADDVLNCTFLDMNDLDDPTVRECAIEPNLQLDQTDLLPHNGWQKVNMQDISVDAAERKITNPIETATPEIDLNYIYSGVIDPSKDAELDKLPDFTLDEGIVEFIEDVNQFVDETALCETLQDHMLELSHSYIEEQIKGFNLQSDATSFVKPYNDANSNINVGDVSTTEDNHQLPSIADLYHLQSKYMNVMNYQTAGLDPVSQYDNAEEISSKHSTELPQDAFEYHESNATNDSSVCPLYGDDISLTTSNNNLVTTNRNLSTSNIIIFNANDLKHDTEPNADFHFSVATLPADELSIKSSMPDENYDLNLNIDTLEKINNKQSDTDSIYEQSLDILTAANLSLIEDIYNSDSSPDEVQQILNLSESEQSDLLDDSADIDSHLDVLDAIDHLQCNGNYLNDLYLSAQMLTHPLILSDKPRNNDLMFKVHPSKTLLHHQ